MNVTKASHHQGIILKVIIVWLFIFLLVGFLIASRSAASEITMSVIPEVPKTGEPIVVTFNINNPSDEPSATSYQLYVNGKLVENGITMVAPHDSSKHQYAYTNLLERGEQVNFVLKTSSDSGNFDKIVSLPAYPSQSMSSFVSFAAFSTSVMSSLVSMEYFGDTFGTTSGLNTGLIVSVILVALLIFLEVTQVAVARKGKGISILASYRAGLSILSTILLIIFIGMVFTKVVMTLVN